MEYPYSIIVPFYNEAVLVEQVLAEVNKFCPEAEIIAVDDGSSDDTRTILERIPFIRVIAYDKNQGQSAAILAGLRAATGKLCVTIDGDGQNDPQDIPTMIKLWTEGTVVIDKIVETLSQRRLPPGWGMGFDVLFFEMVFVIQDVR